MREKVIGILGGMGPEATCEIFRRIIKLTDVEDDKDHIRVIIDSNSKIPDRTKSILYKGVSPINEMVETAKNLEIAGVDFIIMPCITAHYFIDEIQKNIAIPIINALEETNKYVEKTYPSIEKLGILATTGTIKMQLFQHAMKGKEIILPNKEMQEMVMDTIYGVGGIKSGNTSSHAIKKLVSAVETMKSQGIEAVVAGCTEIGLVMTSEYINLPVIDPLTILAKKAIDTAKEIEEAKAIN
ncbi:MAG: aspartate/glutamate racemase family protein [Clostridiaceae bacterium]|nr:aspartate/glutamate racemase family protein [Clostridiaceae bacterium]